MLPGKITNNAGDGMNFEARKKGWSNAFNDGWTQIEEELYPYIYIPDFTEDAVVDEWSDLEEL